MRKGFVRKGGGDALVERGDTRGVVAGLRENGVMEKGEKEGDGKEKVKQS